MYILLHPDGVACVHDPTITTYETLHINILQPLDPF